MTIKVGDYVEFTERYGSYKAGDIVEVLEIEILSKKPGAWFKGKNGEGFAYFSRLKKVEKQVDDSIRITKRVRPGQVVVINDKSHFYLKEGDEIVVHELDNNNSHFWITAHEDRGFWKKGDFICVSLTNVDFKATAKKDKNKRFNTDQQKTIEELEKMLNDLMERVEALEQAEKQRYMVSIDTEEEKPIEQPKTPNQERAAIIEKAKKFVEENSFGSHYDVPAVDGGELNVHFGISDELKFIVDSEKRTVVALILGTQNKKLFHRGIAKCLPDDVFNTHIGKAIALGRALGKDVSEFEDAVKPNKVVVGMVVKDTLSNMASGVVTCVNPKGFSKHESGYTVKGSIWGFLEHAQILNDSKAIYGDIKQ